MGGELLHINVKRFRGGLVFHAHRRLYHSILGLRAINKRRRRRCELEGTGGAGGALVGYSRKPSVARCVGGLVVRGHRSYLLDPYPHPLGRAGGADGGAVFSSLLSLQVLEGPWALS